MNIQWKTGLPFYSEWFLGRAEWDLFFSKTRRREKREGNIYSRFESAIVPIMRMYVRINTRGISWRKSLARARARTQQGTQRRHPSNCLENSPDALRTRTSVPSSPSRCTRDVVRFLLRRGGFAPLPLPLLSPARDGSIERRKWSWRLLLDRFVHVCHPCHTSRVSPILTRRAEILHSDFIDQYSRRRVAIA